MIEILEQAYQKPMNGLPWGADAAKVLYPGVNTCATITAVGDEGVAGLHLGLYMGAGEEGGKGSENSKMMDTEQLKKYVKFFKSKAYKSIGGAVKTIYVAGALDLWADQQGLWLALKDGVNTFAKELDAEKPAALHYFKFDESVAKTVDIHVTKEGVTFKKPRSEDPVPSKVFNP